jgi:hypothetical protein
MNYVKFRISNIQDFLKYEKFRKSRLLFNGLLGNHKIRDQKKEFRNFSS